MVHLNTPQNASKSDLQNGLNTPVTVPDTKEIALRHQKLPTLLSQKPTNYNVHILKIYIHLDPVLLKDHCLRFHKILYKFP
jgi:hypothetical protein